jgi:malonyl CoA-acyl carrier protein transacylase
MGKGMIDSSSGIKIGLIFTGQGFQRIGMYRDLYEKYQEFRQTFEEGNGVLRISASNKPS